MKYIDADKLIAEIKHRIRLNKEMLEIDSRPSDWGRIQEGSYILRFIEYIQQEQPDLPGIEDPGIPGKDFIPVEWVDACEMYGKWKIVRQDQPDVDLEKEIKNYLATKCADDDEPSVSEIARHFYELGLNTRKEETK